MLRIEKRSTEDCITLNHSIHVFQEALMEVRKGAVRFHVTDPEGRVPEYDLSYIENGYLFPEEARKIT